MYLAPRRLYVTADWARVVPEDSPDAAFLLAAEGQRLDEATARRLGLLDEPPAAPEPETKIIAGPPADQAIRKRRTK